MVVPGNSTCLSDLPSAQLTGFVSVRIARITQVVTKVLPASYLYLALLGSPWLTLEVKGGNWGHRPKEMSPMRSIRARYLAGLVLRYGPADRCPSWQLIRRGQANTKWRPSTPAL